MSLDLLDLARALIERPSVTPEDAGCQALIAEELAPSGFTAEHMRFDDVDNVWLKHGNGRPCLVFAGHTDVVPPGPEELWSVPPFSATVRDGRLIGRGAADMKGSLAAMVCAVEEFVARHPGHDGSIALLLTSDEEGRARDGTLKVMETLAARGETIDWCVIGEPSSERTLGDTIRIGRRGSLSGMLTVHGVQGHVAYPDLADNPIRRFAPVLARLYATRWDEGNEYFPPTGFEVVSLSAGTGAPNVTPGELSARFNFRYSTEWTHEALQARVEAMLREHGLDYELRWHLSGKPFLTRPGRLTDAVARAVEETTGTAPAFSTGGGTSDGRFIAPHGVDVVELGPVNASIHKIDEHVEVADLARLATVYTRILELLLLP